MPVSGHVGVQKCDGGRTVRLVAVSDDHNDWFHADDATLCRCGDQVQRLRAWLIWIDEATEDDAIRAAVELALRGEAPDPVGGQD